MITFVRLPSGQTIMTQAPFGEMYELGIHVPTGKLCRIPSVTRCGRIYPNCVKVIRFRCYPDRVKRTPYDEDGLQPKYWALPRGVDMDHEMERRK